MQVTVALALPGEARASCGMSIGFKEWALICEALGSGAQSIILRKGGIAEGRAGFRFKHADFLLLPTLFHEQVAKLKLPSSTAVPKLREDGQLAVRFAAQVEWTCDVCDWALVQRLADFHLWQESEIEKRFRQDEIDLVSLAFVRVRRFAEPFVFPDSPRYGGCRSWVDLPELPDDFPAEAVLSDDAHQARDRAIRALVG